MGLFSLEAVSCWSVEVVTWLISTGGKVHSLGGALVLSTCWGVNLRRLYQNMSLTERGTVLVLRRGLEVDLRGVPSLGGTGRRTVSIDLSTLEWGCLPFPSSTCLRIKLSSSSLILLSLPSMTSRKYSTSSIRKCMDSGLKGEFIC